MALENLLARFKGKSLQLGEVAKGRVSEWLDEYKKASALLQTFGFSVGKFTVAMGILPEIHTSISGSIENIREDALHKMIEQHQGERLSVALLNTLITVRRLWERIESKLTGVTLHVTLGLPPKITAEVH